MKVLIVEDDSTSGLLMRSILSRYGTCDVMTNGEDALRAFSVALTSGNPYDLVCVDIMMPHMDGHEVLAKMRGLERERGVPAEREVKAIMTTALDDPKNVVKALYAEGAAAYLVKPIGRQKLLEEVQRMGLIE